MRMLICRLFVMGASLLWGVCCLDAAEESPDSSAAAAAPHPIPSAFVTPVDVTLTVHLRGKYSSKVRPAWDQKYKTRYQWDGQTAYVTETLPDLEDPSSGRTLRLDAMFREGELVRFQSNLLNDKTENLLALLETTKYGINRQQGYVGDIFNSYSGCAIVGYYDGYSFHEYFGADAEVTVEAITAATPEATPEATTEETTATAGKATDETTTETTGDIIHVTGRSRFGNAQAWLNTKHGNLPERILIEKGPEHLTTAGRLVKDVRFENSDPKSHLTSVTVEVSHVTFKQDGQGRHYLHDCTQSLIEKSERGVEADETVRWSVDSITFEPAFNGGLIDPDVRIKDGDPVSVAGASQLPFSWSRKSRWVVPAAKHLAAGNSRGGRTRYFKVLLINGGVLVGGLVWLLLRRFVPRQTA